LAQALGLPHLFELALGRHILLYGHADRDVVLLSLRHERQLDTACKAERRCGGHRAARAQALRSI